MQPKTQQLKAAKRLLKEALALVTDVQGIVLGCGDPKAAHRLKAIGQRLVDEIELIEQLLAKPSS
jgi:DNA-binding transcriptional regulator LsrR (DeoR family)